MPGARARPQPCVQSKKAHKHSHHGHAGSPGIPRAMVLTGYFALSLVIGLFVTIPAQCEALSRVNISVEMPGPHDFAVRLCLRSSCADKRPPHPALTFVTIAKRPLRGAGHEMQ